MLSRIPLLYGSVHIRDCFLPHSAFVHRMKDINRSTVEQNFSLVDTYLGFRRTACLLQNDVNELFVSIGSRNNHDMLWSSWCCSLSLTAQRFLNSHEHKPCSFWEQQRKNIYASSRIEIWHSAVGRPVRVLPYFEPKCVSAYITKFC
jgi:hypothetical protein